MQRSDLEHYFPVGKQRLLLETNFKRALPNGIWNWLQLVQLAYVQLYLARCSVNRRRGNATCQASPPHRNTLSNADGPSPRLFGKMGRYANASASARRGQVPRRIMPVVKKTPPVAKKQDRDRLIADSPTCCSRCADCFSAVG